jgi:hypothetical protein
MTHCREQRGAHRALLCACMLGILAGCAHHGACTKPEVYERSSNGPALRVPPDLSQPPEDRSFDVPPAPTANAEAPPCGHYPPKITSAAATAKKPAGTSAPAPAPSSAAPAPPPAISLPSPPSSAPTSQTAVTPAVQAELRDVVLGWAKSWTDGNFEEYLRYYAQDFDPPGDLTREEWETARRGILDKHPTMVVSPDTLTVVEAADDRVVVQLVQSSELDGVTSTLRKGLVLVRENGAWRIQQETIVDVLSNPR